MTDQFGDNKSTYDALGRLTSQTSSDGKTISYEYDRYDNITALVYPDGKRLEYTYDTRDRLTGITDYQGEVTPYAYDKWGHVVSVARPNGTISELTYNELGLLTRIAHLVKDKKEVNSFEYTYDSTAQITKETYIENGVSSTKGFSYNDKNQLEKVTEDGKETIYSYDEAGNRVRVTVMGGTEVLEDITYAYNENNQLTSENSLSGEVLYSYDEAGNRIKEEGARSRVYTYDLEDRLTSVYEGGKYLMVALYNGDGNKIFSIDKPSSGTEPEEEVLVGEPTGGDQEVFDRYLERIALEIGIPEITKDIEGYDSNYYVLDVNRQHVQTLATYDDRNNYKDVYSYGLSRLSRSYQNKTEYYHYDGRGSVTSLTDIHGNIGLSYSYDAYGIPEITGTASTNVYMFNGEEYNINTGLSYLRSRHLNHEDGNFLQEDTYLGKEEQPLSLNRYSYVMGNPVLYNDPSGHFFNLAAAGAGALVGGITGALVGATHTTVTGLIKGDFSWKSVVKSTAVGLVSGAAGGATAGFTLNPVAGAAVYGATAGAVGGVLNSVLSGGSVKETIVSAGAGALVGGATGGLLGKYAPKITSNIIGKTAIGSVSHNASQKLTAYGIGTGTSVIAGMTIRAYSSYKSGGNISAIVADTFNPKDLTADALAGLAASIVADKTSELLMQKILAINREVRRRELCEGYEELDPTKTVAESAIEGGTASPSEIAKSWQGSGKYPGIDKYKDITIKQDKIIYRGEPNGTDYFTTKSAIERSGYDANNLFEGLQVEKNLVHGYRSEMQGYKATIDLEAAIGLTKANPQFGKGGLPQVFIPDANKLIQKGYLVPVENIPLKK